MRTSTLLIAGAGGLGREVLAALNALGKEVGGFLVEDGYSTGDVAGLPVYSDPRMWAEASEIAVAIGDLQIRKRLAGRLTGRCLTVTHPAANIGPRVTIGEGGVIIGAANITCDVAIGQFVLINPGCTIAHDCKIGSFSNLGPSVSLAGNVSVGEGVNIGTGAVVLPGCQVGDYATIGAGAVVVRNVAPGSVAYGVPARTIQKS